MTKKADDMIRNSLFLLALASVLLSGCSGKDPKIYDPNGPVADGDVLIESEPYDAKTLNPPLISEVAGADIDGLVFNGLTRYNDKLEIEPCLAEKWKVSKDGKTITYYLRRGVKFHDGVEFMANDVLFTYQVYTDKTVNTPEGAMYQDVKSVEVMGPYEVKVTFKRPFALALSLFDTILPKHLLEGQDINTSDFGRHPIGTGPYKFVEWKTDQRIVLQANPDYWEGAPHIKKFVMRVIPDQSTQFLELLDGGLDCVGAWLHGTLSAEQYVLQSNTPKLKNYYNVYKTHSLEYTYIGWNELNPLFSDKKVRQALTMAIDRNAIIQNAMNGLADVCTGPFPYGSWATNPKVQPWPYDPEKARKLLKEAGWKMGADGLLHKKIANKDTPFRFTLILTQGKVDRERSATIIQQQLKKVGIQVDIRILEWTALLSQYLEPKKFDACIMGWSLNPDPDCYTIFASTQTGQYQQNMVSYKNKKVDGLLLQGRQTLDQAKRQKIYWQIHSLLSEDQPYTFLYIPDQLTAIHRRFKGYTMNDFDILTHPEGWYVPQAQQKYSQ